MGSTDDFVSGVKLQSNSTTYFVISRETKTFIGNTLNTNYNLDDTTSY